ncbi:MAG: DNA translocase FtsK [bacterium]|nr:DNA translocase FtsK [bacterium]
MKKKIEPEKLPTAPRFRDETRHGIAAIIFIILSIFFALARFEMAGPAGNFTYTLLYKMFGTGYLLFSLICLMLGLSFLRSIRPNIFTVSLLGGLFFLLSSLGVLDVIFTQSTGETITGGLVGHLVSAPFLMLFDKIITVIFLVAVSIISVLIMFETQMTLEWSLFGKKLFTKDEDVPGGDIPLEEVRLAVPEPLPKPVVEQQKEEEKISEPPREERSKKTITEKIGSFFDDNLRAKSNKQFDPPPLSLLETDTGKPDVGDIKANANIIKRTLLNFGIDVEMDEISIGPSITRYSLKPAEGVKLSRILALQNDLALALAAHPIRIEAPIPGKSLVGIEIPNKAKSTVGLGTLLAAKKFQESTLPLLIPFGKGVSGIPYFGDLAKAPHMLIAGTTGSGKSVTIHTIITALLYRNPPEHLRFIMIDPKRVELTLYNGIPHLLTPVITDPKKAILSLKWAAKEMERRYNILEQCVARDINSYHQYLADKLVANKEEKADSKESMPFIVIIIDELATIMSAYPRELEAAIVRLAQMSRAVGIHIILSTQRPSVEIITGLIKANVPSRIALQVPSQIDSRTILDMPGAEKLLGAGDMLYITGDTSKPVRVQSGYISENEVKKVVKYLKDTYKEELPDEIALTEAGDTSSGSDLDFGSGSDEEGGEDDEMYEEAKELVIKIGKASSSLLQRKLKLGYARAARIIDLLEEKGVIGPGDGARPREVYQKDPVAPVHTEENLIYTEGEASGEDEEI